MLESEFEDMNAQKKRILAREKTTLLRPYVEKITQLEEDAKDYERIVALHEEINGKLKLLVGTFYCMLAASYHQDCLEGYYDEDDEYYEDGD